MTVKVFGCKSTFDNSKFIITHILKNKTLIITNLKTLVITIKRGKNTSEIINCRDFTLFDYEQLIMRVLKLE